jgi:hypothetical protein
MITVEYISDEGGLMPDASFACSLLYFYLLMQKHKIVFESFFFSHYVLYVEPNRIGFETKTIGVVPVY